MTDPNSDRPVRIFAVSEGDSGRRLDKFLAIKIARSSRTAIKHWIIADRVRVTEGDIPLKRLSPSMRVRPGQKVEVKCVPSEEERVDVAQDIPLPIVWHDDDLLVIDKPAGLVVHPGAGNEDRTLVNALLHWRPNLYQLPRTGIVHRLDKDTTGLMIVALSARCQMLLVKAFKARKMDRRYLAIVVGVPISGGRIDAPLARHPRMRTKFVVGSKGKKAVSHYRVLRKYRRYSVIEARLETGRTHQIRVHLQHAGFPIVGDRLYGPRRCGAVNGEDGEFADLFAETRRQMLHSWKLNFVHPGTRERMTFTAPIPADMRDRLSALIRLEVGG